MSNYKYVLKRDTKDDRDYKFKEYVRQTNVKIPENVDLRNNMPTIFSQNQEGSCTANAGVANIEYLEYTKKNNKPVLSRQYLYNKERINDGTDLSQDEGSSIRQICNTLTKNGCCDENFLTYGLDNLTTVPSQEAEENASNHKAVSYHRINTNDEIKQALALGLPVLLGISVYSSFEEVGKDGNIPIPNTSKEELLGGHATLLVGFYTSNASQKINTIIAFIFRMLHRIFKSKFSLANKNTTKYILRNSWGQSIKTDESWGYAFDNPSDSGFGDNGYGYLTDECLDAIKQDVWVITQI